MHLSADDVDQAGGTAVQTWTSATEPAVTGTATNEGTAPALVLGALNGANALRFDGIDDRLNLSENLFSSTSIPRTVFAVTQNEGYSGHIIGTGSSNTGDLTSDGYAIGIAAHKPFFKANTNSAGVWLLSADNVALTTQPSITSARTSDINAELVSRCQRLVSGGAPMPAEGEITSIGASEGAFFSGDLAEIIVYDRALDDTEFQAVRTYLSDRYGAAVPAMLDSDDDGTFDACDTNAMYLNYEVITPSVEEPADLKGTPANIVDAESATSFDPHSDPTHVWADGSDMIVRLDFDGVYDIQRMHFWNFTGEGYDVDTIEAQFYDANDQLVEELMLGSEANTAIEHGFESILAQDFAIEAAGVSYVKLRLAGSNSQAEYQNIGFTGTPAQ